jgi:hypothetical protein
MTPPASSTRQFTWPSKPASWPSAQHVALAGRTVVGSQSGLRCTRPFCSRSRCSILSRRNCSYAKARSRRCWQAAAEAAQRSSKISSLRMPSRSPRIVCWFLVGEACGAHPSGSAADRSPQTFKEAVCLGKGVFPLPNRRIAPREQPKPCNALPDSMVAGGAGETCSAFRPLLSHVVSKETPSIPAHSSSHITFAQSTALKQANDVIMVS